MGFYSTFKCVQMVGAEKTALHSVSLLIFLMLGDFCSTSLLLTSYSRLTGYPTVFLVLFKQDF